MKGRRKGAQKGTEKLKTRYAIVQVCLWWAFIFIIVEQEMYISNGQRKWPFLKIYTSIMCTRKPKLSLVPERNQANFFNDGRALA